MNGQSGLKNTHSNGEPLESLTYRFFRGFSRPWLQLGAWEWREGSAKRPQTAGFFRPEKSRWKGGGAAQPAYPVALFCPPLLEKVL